MAIRIIMADLSNPLVAEDKARAFETQVSDFVEMIDDKGWVGPCQIATAGSSLVCVLQTLHSDGRHVKRKSVDEAEKAWAEKKARAAAGGATEDGGRILKA